jgi:hypothetical protein
MSDLPKQAGVVLQYPLQQTMMNRSWLVYLRQ